MNEFVSHYRILSGIVEAELKSSSGCEWLQKKLATPFDSVTLAEINNWTTRLASLISRKCWGSQEFRKTCKAYPENLLIVAETGDMPSIIKIGYPKVASPLDFSRLELLKKKKAIELPDLISCISGIPYSEAGYEFCAIHKWGIDEFGMNMPEFEDWEHVRLTHLMVDSVALISMIQSWRSLGACWPKNMYFCTSTGYEIFGCPTLISEEIPSSVKIATRVRKHK